MPSAVSGGGRLISSIARHGYGAVATITISRPAKLNCLDSSLLCEIPNVLRRILSKEEDLRGIVLTGDGEKAFVAGADLVEMGGLDGPESARQFITKVHLACKAVRDCPVPVVARINGVAFGAGLELAAACDVRVASNRALFGMPEVRMGLPSVVEAALLPSLIGWGRTRRLLLFGETIDAEEACRWGLVEKSVDHDLLDGEVLGLMNNLSECGRVAVRKQKALINEWQDAPSMTSAIQAGIQAFADAYGSPYGAEPEPKIMIERFLGKSRERKRHDI